MTTNKYTQAITDRWRQAAKVIIERHRQTGGKITNYKLLGESLGVASQNISRYTTSNQHVTMPMFEVMCRVHKVDPVWLTFGTGEMFAGEKPQMKASEFEERLERIEAKLIAMSKSYAR